MNSNGYVIQFSRDARPNFNEAGTMGTVHDHKWRFCSYRPSVKANIWTWAGGDSLSVKEECTICGQHRIHTYATQAEVKITYS